MIGAARIWRLGESGYREEIVLAAPPRLPATARRARGTDCPSDSTRARARVSRDGAIRPTGRAPVEIRVQIEAKDGRKQWTRDGHADDSPAARAATPNLRRDDARTTKHPGRGVTRDLARRSDDLRRR